MPSISVHGKVFRNWESIIGAANETLSKFPGAEPLRDELVAILEQARALKVQQENLTSLRMDTTQRLNVLVEEGWDKARRLQSFARSQLGPKSEQLPQFGVAPNRKRSRQPKRSEQKAAKRKQAQEAEGQPDNPPVTAKATE